MPERLHLSRLEFRAGPVAAATPLAVDVPKVTIFVGPNNSGKSLALREIETWCRGGNEQRRVVASLEAAWPATPEDSVALLRPFESDPPQGQLKVEGYQWIFYPSTPGEGASQGQINFEGLKAAVSRQDDQTLRAQLLRAYTLRLDGRTRFSLADPQPTGDLQAFPQNQLWALFQNDKARRAVRRLTAQAFGLHFVIDPTGMTTFRPRMSTRAPRSKAEEQALDEQARRFHSNAALLTELGDGVQAFTGLISSVRSSPQRILLIDEPEAFLHPPLARRLGTALTRLVGEREASLIAATHSADFVIGCIEETPDVAVIRLTYEQPEATARYLPTADLEELMRDPLLRSTDALRGLFHRAVVVTEGDNDRAFYDEINRRLQAVDRGIDEALFVNAQNWQTTFRIIAPLRRLGIPAAAIVDLDSLTGNGSWHRFYEAANIDGSRRTRLETRRMQCLEYLQEVPEVGGQRAHKVKGVAALSGRQRQHLSRFIRDLGDYGLFPVPVGELERWLPDLGLKGSKTSWVVNAFARLGSDPSAADYVRPGNKDVWHFLDRIGAWVRNPSRVGIPE